MLESGKEYSLSHTHIHTYTDKYTHNTHKHTHKHVQVCVIIHIPAEIIQIRSVSLDVVAHTFPCIGKRILNKVAGADLTLEGLRNEQHFVRKNLQKCFTTFKNEGPYEFCAFARLFDGKGRDAVS